MNSQLQQRLSICQTCNDCSIDRCRLTNRLVSVMAVKDEHSPCGKWPGDPKPKEKNWERDPFFREEGLTLPPNTTCDVIIPCHNYGHFLKECVESVRASSIKTNINIVDDSSTDDAWRVASKLGETYIRINARSAIRARQAGFEAGSSPYVLFLDADDRVSQHYIRCGVALMHRDASVGIVYSDFEYFGDREGNRRLNYDSARISQQNSIHAGSIYRRAALEISRAMQLQTTESSHDDWAVARRVIRDGWKVEKNPTPYHYRQHSRSMMQTRDRSVGSFYHDANLEREPITLAIPISGRTHAMDEMFQFLVRQTRDRSTIKLILADGSNNPGVEFRIKSFLRDSEYPDARYLKLDVGQRPGLADEDRRANGETRADVRLVMARIYARLRSELTTQYVWILEDDVIPPDDCCDRLLRSMAPSVAAVAAPYRSRYHANYVAYRPGHQSISRPGVCLEEIEATGFGCILFRTAVLNRGPLTHVGKFADYDLNFFEWLKTQPEKLLLDWSCEAEHLGAMLV